ncbi:MAG: ABC transporter permease subunit [Bacteroidia bacterium]|nr:ABC transporter permease subunit [Bacteroidia bacterium]
MKNIWIIANREFRTFLDSLVAYILLVVFLGLSGFFTWLFGTDVFYIKQATLLPFFQIAYWTLFFFIPALTMRMIAEEKRVGTLETLLTRAITDWQIVAGKYLACLLLIGVALLFTLPYYFTVSWLGPIDHGAVWCGYLGLLLLSSVYISIGIFASSITSNQIVAFLLALVIGIVFHWIFDLMSSVASGSLAGLMNYLSTSSHFASVSRGVIDSRDIIYFVSLSLLGLILAEAQLASRNVVD